MENYMGYEGVWLIRGMAYEGVDCNVDDGRSLPEGVIVRDKGAVGYVGAHFRKVVTCTV
jgi:hypothetical protein